MRNIRSKLREYKETMGFLNLSRRFFSIKIYTDGSCVNNGKPYARGAFGIYFPNHEHMNVSKTYPLTIPPTNITSGGTVTLKIYCNPTSTNHYLTVTPTNASRIGIALN